MQPRFTVGKLVLQAEGLVSAIRYLGFLFQTALAGMVTKPHEVAVFIGHLTRDTDLVAVEVVGLLVAFASERVAFYGNAAIVIASVNGGQIAVAKIDFGKQQPCAAVRGGDLVEVVWKKVISTQQPNRFLIKQTAKFEVRSNVSSCNVDKFPSFLTLIYP